jgi:hypothetical protein
MTRLIGFVLRFALALVGKFRALLYGLGGGALGFFLIQSYGQWNAHFLYERAMATATKIEKGCLTKERDVDGNRLVVPCSDAARAFTKTETPYVTYHFTDASGRPHRGIGAVGAVGFPREGRPGESFEVLFDPENPSHVEAPIGRRYFEFTVPVGLIGAFLLGVAILSRRWARAMANGAMNVLMRRAYADIARHSNPSR